MPNPKRLEQTALIGLLLQLVFLVLCAFMGTYSGSDAVRAETAHLAAGLLVWAMVLFHGRARRRAEEERDERERLKSARLSEEMFDEMELDTISAGTMLRIFEKWVVPIASVLLSVSLIGLGIYVLGDRLPFVGEEGVPREVTAIERPAMVAVVMVFMAFGMFLIGRYAAGLAQSRSYRLLRAAGGYLMGNVIAALLICVAMALNYFDYTVLETIVAWAVPILMAIVGVEVLLNLILDIYRPRVVGQERRPPYDSRLLGLFAEPGSVLETVASTLDYQFGFKVSETWFYQFMEKAILPLLVVQLAALWLMSCLVVVNPEEAAFIEYLGVPRGRVRNEDGKIEATVYENGYYLKLPWPIETVRRAKIHEIEIPLGRTTNEEEATGEITNERYEIYKNTRLWSQPHVWRRGEREELYLIPGGRSSDEGASEAEASALTSGGETIPEVNFARTEVMMRYRVRQEDGKVDPAALYEYVYGRAEVDDHARLIASRALWHVAASQDFTAWMTVERDKVRVTIEEAVINALEEDDLGIEVTFVGVEAIQPPLQVYEPYEKGAAAQQQRQTLIQNGRTSAVQIKRDAEIEAINTVAAAESEKLAIEQEAEGDAEMFMAQWRVAAAKTELGRVMPIFLQRLYCETLEDALPGHKVYVVPPTAHEVNLVNMETRASGAMMESLAGN